MKTIVQIGTANAEDHVLDYIKEQKFDVFGIFIEPNPYSIAATDKHLNSFGFSMKEINKEHGSIVYGK